MKKAQIKAVIFDMDGVILDSETICWKTWEITAAELNLKDIQTANDRCMGTNRNDTLNILKEFYGNTFNAEAFLQRTFQLFHEIEDKEGIPAMPFAREALEYLSKKYTLALASSTKQEAVHRQLKAIGVFDYFKTITTGDMVKHSKPDPEIYLKACQSINLTPEECCAIEDSPNGIISAYSAGLKPIMVPDKIQPSEEIQKKCWKLLPSLKEISSIL